MAAVRVICVRVCVQVSRAHATQSGPRRSRRVQRLTQTPANGATTDAITSTTTTAAAVRLRSRVNEEAGAFAALLDEPAALRSARTDAAGRVLHVPTPTYHLVPDYDAHVDVLAEGVWRAR
jgi:tellurite resistance protein